MKTKMAPNTFRVRDTQGRYRQINRTELLNVARHCILQDFKAGPALTSPTQTRAQVQTLIGGCKREVFAVIWLDNRHRVIRYSELFKGTIDGTTVYPREVVKDALSCNAAAAVLLHNHPSGVSEPSRADQLITRRLKEVLSLIDVRVIDHLVVGETVTSFAERGLL